MTLDLEKLLVVANSLVSISQKLPSNANPDRSGGILTIGLDNLSVRHVLEIGNYTPREKERYLRFSQEKAYRVCADWLRDQDNTISSWQTRQPEIDRYGGAVLFSSCQEYCNIISFSGLNELSDEALSLTLGYHLGFETNSEFAERVINISKNIVFKEMYKIFSEQNI